MKTATVVRPRFGVAAPLGISLLPCLLLRASSCSCSVYPRTNALRRRRAATRRPHGIPLHQIDPSFSPPPLVPLVDHTMCRPRSGLRSEEARGTRIPTGLPMVLLTRAYGAKPFYLSGRAPPNLCLSLSLSESRQSHSMPLPRGHSITWSLVGGASLGVPDEELPERIITFFGVIRRIVFKVQRRQLMRGMKRYIDPNLTAHYRC
jgi:hypothetical protein